MWEILQSYIIPIVVIFVIIRFFGGGASGGVPGGASNVDMEFLKDTTLTKRDRSKKKFSEATADAEIIALYFSAHWCPPCRQFTPVLADVYNELKRSGKKFEIIFVSSDRTEDAMIDYMTNDHGDWYAVEFGTSTKEQLGSHFGVRGIPTLIVLKKDGQVVSKSGREDVGSLRSGAWDKWTA